MIEIDEIKRLAKIQKLTPSQQEKHYIQTVALSGIYTIIANELMFKGGTALFFFYGLDRFSEDLDFTKTGPINAPKLKTTVSNMFDLLNIPHEIKKAPSLAGDTWKIKAKGPLYKGPLSESIVRIEISECNDVVLEPDIKEITPMYNDLRPFTIPIMKKEEILAEKTRALLTRVKARDLYDAAFLLKKGVQWDINLVEKKLAYYKKHYDAEELKTKVMTIKDIWKSELHGLVACLPQFDDVLQLILTTLKENR
ncbi:MAG: nucleotidyl transferase AbiEii/AbiGii toxin family protein [Methanobacteriota archaeon]